MFPPVSPDGDTAVSSQLGMVGGEQKINLAGAPNKGTVIHEMMHSMGFYGTRRHGGGDEEGIVDVQCPGGWGGRVRRAGEGCQSEWRGDIF